jgi:hypothetical protein
MARACDPSLLEAIAAADDPLDSDLVDSELDPVDYDIVDWQGLPELANANARVLKSFIFPVNRMMAGLRGRMRK